MIVADIAMADQAHSTLDDRLTLRVTIDDETRQIPLRDGLTLGTDAEIDDIFIRPVGPIRRNDLTAIVKHHDGVLALFSFDNQAPIVLPNGMKTTLLRLHHGTKFKIGVVQFECIALELETREPDSNDPIEPDVRLPGTRVRAAAKVSSAGRMQDSVPIAALHCRMTARPGQSSLRCRKRCCPLHG